MDNNDVREEEKPFIGTDTRPRKSSLSNNRSRFQVAKVDFAAIDEVADGDDTGSNTLVSDRYDTHNVASLRHYTHEPLPRASHYRDIRSIHTHLDRPTLDELHNPQITLITPDGFKIQSPEQRKKSIFGGSRNGVKLGWIEGVFVRCLLNIWGVILFIRLSWIVANAGIGLTCLIILLASLVTTITSLSMSAICTNGEVKAGGTYYMISRSLGPEFGGSIGLIFSLANAVAIALYAVGFAEVLVSVIGKYGWLILSSNLDNIRLISVITVVILLLIALTGTEWESKTQMILLGILLAAIFNFLLGAVLPPNSEQITKGYIGWSTELIKDNFFSDFRNGYDFFSLFAIFFPAATGILAGANISGDLKDPQKSIPLGTILAILISTISYLLLAFVSGSTVLREVCLPSNSTVTSQPCQHLLIDGKKQGLHYNHNVMELVSAYGPIINAGAFAATLSSGLVSLVSAPKVFQALCKDKLFPLIESFAQGYGKNNEPKRGYILAFVIAIVCCLQGDLDMIAPIISNFFLAAYCLINFSCFYASFSGSLGFRPSFKFYNMWVSLIGSILCMVTMFIINWQAALATFVIVFALYLVVLYRKPDVNWGSSTQAETYNRALRAVKKLNDVPDHVKNFRPQILVLSGRPSARIALVEFANCISKKISLLACGHVEVSSLNQRTRHNLSISANNFFRKRRIEAFYFIKEDESFSKGAKALMEVAGIGKLRPNVLLMGYKSDWHDCTKEEVLEYFKTVHYAFDLHMSVCILRLPGGFDYSEYAEGIENALNNIKNLESHANQSNEHATNSKDIELGFPRNTSSAQLSGAVLKPTASWFTLFAAFSASGGGSSRETTPPSTPVLGRDGDDSDGTFITFKAGGNHSKGDDNLDEHKKNDSKLSNKSDNKNNVKNKEEDKIKRLELVKEQKILNIPKEVLYNMNIFKRKQKKGTIDVWWLYDDGGLTMLIPHILSTRSQWKHCTLRVFTLANRKDELDREKRNMAALLSKFRIDFSDVTVIPDIVKPPSEENLKAFDEIIEKWKEKDENGIDQSGLITEAELIALRDKSRRHIRLRELLLKYSSDASLIVMTLTVPRKGTCSAPLFMAWLDTLTLDMPPFLLVRGNQTSVLTFYS